MLPRRIILLIICTLLLFLGIYTWNQRTGQWDRLCAAVGLEFTGGIMRGLDGLEDTLSGVWNSYVDLRDVRRENDELKARLRVLEQRLAGTREESAELIRLRRLMHLEYPASWPARASRVLAWRMGPNAALSTIMLSSGYMSGAAPGTPVTSWEGVVGRVLKAGPSTSVALLLTDTGSRVAVLTSEGRVQGILSGGGPGVPLELRFVRQNAPVRVGELLVTSGLDSCYPKGIPLAREGEGPYVTHATIGKVVDFHRLEEVFLLQRPLDSITPESDVVYTRRTPVLEKPEEPAPETGGTR